MKQLLLFALIREPSKEIKKSFFDSKLRKIHTIGKFFIKKKN